MLRIVSTRPDKTGDVGLVGGKDGKNVGEGPGVTHHSADETTDVGPDTVNCWRCADSAPVLSANRELWVFGRKITSR
jgi:hypothetical protein